MNSYRFAYAWLGGDTLERDVTIRVDDGVISHVGTGDGIAIEGVALPGMVTTHSHAFHRALRGQTHEQGGDFWAWRQPMYELAGKLTPDTYYTLSKDVFEEMLRSGYTAVGEFHYVHHQPDGTQYDDPNAMGHAVLAAASDAGIRITLLDTLYLTSDVDGSPPRREQMRFSDGSFGAWATRVETIETKSRQRIGVAAHSVRAVPPMDLRNLAVRAEDWDSPFHVHVSEQTAENEACLDVHGTTPVGLLERSSALSDRTTLVHATHPTPDDMDRIAAHQAGVCFCPTTEADLGDGIGPAHELAQAGVEMSLGSDSNAIVDPFEETRRVEHHDRLRLGRRGVHSPASLLEMATLHGGRALGWDCGSLAPGKLADIVVVDPNHDDLFAFGENLALGAISLAATRAAVTHVLVDGRMIVS